MPHNSLKYQSWGAQTKDINRVVTDILRVLIGLASHRSKNNSFL